MRTPELLIILKSMNLLKIWSNLILALQYFFQKIQIVLHQGVGCIQKFSLTHIIYTSQNLTASILYWPKGNNSWKNMSAMLFPGIPIYIPVSRAYASMHLLVKCWFSATQITCQFLLLQYSDIYHIQYTNVAVCNGECDGIAQSFIAGCKNQFTIISSLVIICSRKHEDTIPSFVTVFSLIDYWYITILFGQHDVIFKYSNFQISIKVFNQVRWLILHQGAD